MSGTEPQFGHEKYEELCALETAGVLTPAESEKLHTHLTYCAECSETFAQYRSIATEGMSVLADQFAALSDTAAFDASSALTRLMRATEPPRPRLVPASESTINPRLGTRALLAGLIAAALFVGASVVSYRIGWMRSKVVTASVANAPLAMALNRITSEKKALGNTIQADSQLLATLAQQVAENKSEAEKYRAQAKADADKLSSVTDSFAASRNQLNAQVAALTQERDASAARLRNAENLYRTAQDELNTLRSQHQQDLLRMASLEDRVDGLSASLKDQNTRVKVDERYLSSDKDIRNLIAARNLYIADIMDVRDNGTARKPFGRIFYTKSKSLIFYAYDLDRQPGVKRASTFQVWGRREAGDNHPVNLGILYMDSETNRCWTLRVDNPDQLASLDSVFVTIEPREQTDKPTGKPFLYASLRREPNHP